MTIKIVIAGVIALIAVGTAHTAGAGYVMAHQSGKSSVWAVVRTLMSLGLVTLALNLAR